MRRRTVARSVRLVSNRFGEVGGQLDRRRAREMGNRDVREPWAQTGRFLRVMLVSGHGRFSSYEGPQGVAHGQEY